MALSRKSLKAMGLTDEQVDSIIEMHAETVDGLKEEIHKYKADAEKLPGVQKELDDLKAKATTAGRISTIKSKRILTTTSPVSSPKRARRQRRRLSALTLRARRSREQT